MKNFPNPNQSWLTRHGSKVFDPGPITKTNTMSVLVSQMLFSLLGVAPAGNKGSMMLPAPQILSLFQVIEI